MSIVNKAFLEKKFETDKIKAMVYSRKPAPAKARKEQHCKATDTNRTKMDKENPKRRSPRILVEPKMLAKEGKTKNKNKSKAKEDIANIFDDFEEEENEDEDEDEDETWQNQYQKLVVFQAKHHHCNPEIVQDKETGLQEWAANQRLLCHRNELAEPRKKLLDNLGIAWHRSSGNHEKSWIESFTLVSNLFETTGSFSTDDEKLREWKKRQRKLSKEGGLLRGRKERLEKIKFPFEHNSSKKRNLEDTVKVTEPVKKSRGASQGTNKSHKASPIAEDKQQTKPEMNTGSRPNMGTSVPDPFAVLAPLIIQLRGLKVQESCLVDCCNFLQRVVSAKTQSQPSKKPEGDVYSRLLSLALDLRNTLSDPQNVCQGQLDDCTLFLKLTLDEAKKGLTGTKQ